MGIAAPWPVDEWGYDTSCKNVDLINPTWGFGSVFPSKLWYGSVWVNIVQGPWVHRPGTSEAATIGLSHPVVLGATDFGNGRLRILLSWGHLGGMSPRSLLDWPPFMDDISGDTVSPVFGNRAKTSVLSFIPGFVWNCPSGTQVRVAQLQSLRSSITRQFWFG